jgi:hypothetical protein
MIYSADGSLEDGSAVCAPIEDQVVSLSQGKKVTVVGATRGVGGAVAGLADVSSFGLQSELPA